MRGSWKLFTMFGIPVHLHWSFGLIFLYAMYIGYSQNEGLGGTLWIMLFFVALFACVLLHEYGHALTARRYGVATQDIILTPIGGIARLERMPEKPLHEFVVAIMGPMVNVVIAILLVALGRLIFHGSDWDAFRWFLEQQFFTDTDSTEVMEDAGLNASGLLFYMPVLVATNIALVLFNLIPAFPMDGGRVFRALLALRLGRVRATRVAALVGQVIAVFFILLGLWQSAFTVTLIGIFVFTTARAENNMVRLEDLLQRFRARDVMRPVYTKIMANDWMQTPIGYLQQGLERHFLVFDMEGNLVGRLNENSILQALRKRDISASASDYMHAQVEFIGAGDSLRGVYYYLFQLKNGIIGVVENGELIGVIDEAGFGNFMRTQNIQGL